MDIKEQNAKAMDTMYANLSALRWSKGWSLAQLADLSGIDTITLTQIESGEDFEAFYLFQLCQLYGFAISDIFSPLSP